MIAGKQALSLEIKGLQELLELYVASNPDHDRKPEPKVEERKVEVDPVVLVQNALYLFAKVHLV